MVLDQARHCIENNLFKLQTNDQMVSCSKELLQGCMVLLSCIQEDKEIKNKAISQIHEVRTYVHSGTKYLHLI